MSETSITLFIDADDQSAEWSVSGVMQLPVGPEVPLAQWEGKGPIGDEIVAEIETVAFSALETTIRDRIGIQGLLF